MARFIIRLSSWLQGIYVYVYMYTLKLDILLPSNAPYGVFRETCEPVPNRYRVGKLFPSSTFHSLLFIKRFGLVPTYLFAKIGQLSLELTVNSA